MKRPQVLGNKPAHVKQRPQAQKKKLQPRQQQRKPVRRIGTGKRLLAPPRTLNERFARLQQQRMLMLQKAKLAAGTVQKRRPLKKQVSLNSRGVQKPAAGSPQQRKKWQGRRGGGGSQ